MRTPVRRDDLLDQILALPIEDRDYIEAALIREAYEQHRRTDTEEKVTGVVQRASDALSECNTGFSREAAVARARAAVEAARARKLLPLTKPSSAW